MTPRPSPLPLFWYRDTPNFGDALAPLLVEKFSGRRVVASTPRRCRMCAVGSILDSFFSRGFSLKRRLYRRIAPPVLVWGGGFIQPEREGWTDPRRRLDVRAVRGKLSRERIRKYLGIDKEIALGDPGLLCAGLLEGRTIPKTHDLGIIPHYIDRDNPLLDRFPAGTSIRINVGAPPLDVLEQIASCRAVISSAMHGLIAADSLGIPNIRMVLGGKLMGGDYKFDDYYSAFGIEHHPRVVLDATGPIPDARCIIERHAVSREMVETVSANLLAALHPLPA